MVFCVNSTAPARRGVAGLRRLAAAFRADERGATMIEYTVLIAVMAIALIASVGPIGDTLAPMLESAQDAVEDLRAPPE